MILKMLPLRSRLILDATECHEMIEAKVLLQATLVASARASYTYELPYGSHNSSYESSPPRTALCFSKSWGMSYKPAQQDLRVAQLVERETVRVALYLEVACSTQALEIPFANHLIFHFADFPLYRGIYCRERRYPA